MKKIAFFDAKPYDRESFEAANHGRYEIVYYEAKLTERTAPLAKGADAVCAFVNDTIDAATIKALAGLGVKVAALRCAGYNNVDFKTAYDAGLTVVRVPAYSPNAVAEHALALLMTVNRRLHKAYSRTREYNFSLVGLEGVVLNGRTAGIIGTGKIGRVFAGICKGLGMNVIAYDLFPNPASGLEYVTLDRLLAESDVISLHCPLTPETEHMLNAAAFAKMKRGAILINTSRGALVDSIALLSALRSGQVGAAGLDVYEEESEWFFEDRSAETRQDEILSLLVAQPNVLVTSHQAFLTREALSSIAGTTLDNLDAYFSGAPLANEICYRCAGKESKANATCPRRVNGRCHRP